MTRINCGIKPKELSNKHLFAEIRELKRIPNCIKNGKYNLDGIPENFKLGTGHVKFFYNKLRYLHKRFLGLQFEWLSRGFTMGNYIEVFNDLPSHLYNDYKPTQADRDILIERLKQKDFEHYKNLS